MSKFSLLNSLLMNLRHIKSKLTLAIAVIFARQCGSKDCKQITEKDVVGFYISMNNLNEDLQYLEILEHGTYKNKYCVNGKMEEENGKWKYIENCTVYLDNIYWPNSPHKKNDRGGAHFSFEDYKVLSMGDDVWSFEKVSFSPTLECE
jgi:hypothetical protein